MSGPQEPRRCSRCGKPMDALLFLGEQEDGFVCAACGLYVAPDSPFRCKFYDGSGAEEVPS